MEEQKMNSQKKWDKAGKTIEIKSLLRCFVLEKSKKGLISHLQKNAVFFVAEVHSMAWPFLVGIFASLWNVFFYFFSSVDIKNYRPIGKKGVQLNKWQETRRKKRNDQMSPCLISFPSKFLVFLGFQAKKYNESREEALLVNSLTSLLPWCCSFRCCLSKLKSIFVILLYSIR